MEESPQKDKDAHTYFCVVGETGVLKWEQVKSAW